MWTSKVQEEKFNLLTNKNNKKCEKAKRDIAKLQQKIRMIKTDNKTGKKTFIEDSERADIIKKSRKEVKKYCK